MLQKSDDRTLGENGDFVLRTWRQSRATRKYRIMLGDTFVAARGRAGQPPLMKHKSCANMSGTRLQKRARAGAQEATLFRGFRTRRFRRWQKSGGWRDECASGELVRAAGRAWRHDPDSGGTHESIEPSGG